MRADTFKNWLESKGCRFDEHNHERSEGHASLLIKLGEKHSVLPLIGTHQDMDGDDVSRILRDLGLDAGDLPQHTEGQGGRKPGERHDRLLDRQAKADAHAGRKARKSKE